MLKLKFCDENTIFFVSIFFLILEYHDPSFLLAGSIIDINFRHNCCGACNSCLLLSEKLV